VGFILAIGLSACGESNTSSPGAAGSPASAGAAAGGTASGGTGAGGASAGQSSAGSSAAGAEGKAGSAANGGASGGAPAVPTAVPSLQCAQGEFVYEGKVGGVAIMERLTLTGPAAGVSVLGAYSGGVSVVIPDGTTVGAADKLASGVLVFPAGSAHAGEIWCIDSGSLLAKGKRPSGALIGHPLGKCPGTAVAGTLHACFDSDQGYCDDAGEPAKRSLGGDLAGKTLESPALGLTTVSSQAWASNTTLFDVMLFAGSVPSAATSAKINGYLIAAEGSPDLGDVYCVGDGDWSKYSDEFVDKADVATLKQISRVGSCKAAGPVDALNVCIGF
jgi:hypothetical protein